jgi:hypothetical protein
MIGKLNGLRHLKITSNPNKDKNKDNHNNSGDQKDDNFKKDKNNHEEKNDSPKVIPIELILNELNSNHYYKKKDMTFELLSTNDGETILVKSKETIIKRLNPSEIYTIFERVKKQDEDSPIKGGLLNINI